MRLIWSVFVMGTLATAAGAVSVLAGAEPGMVCCSSQVECGGTMFCCPYDVLDLLPCDAEEPYYCVASCVRPNGGLP